MPGPVNGIMGESFVADLPEVAPVEVDLTEERAAAKFSKSKEFKRLKAHLEARIAYYQKFLPDGSPVPADPDFAQLGRQWVVANAMVAEFQEVINFYEQAGQTVDEAARRAFQV